MSFHFPPPPLADSFVIGTAGINTHRDARRPGRMRSWSGPVETDFQGRLRFSSGNRPASPVPPLLECQLAHCIVVSERTNKRHHHHGFPSIRLHFNQESSSPCCTRCVIRQTISSLRAADCNANTTSPNSGLFELVPSALLCRLVHICLPLPPGIYRTLTLSCHLCTIHLNMQRASGCTLGTLAQLFLFTWIGPAPQYPVCFFL
jgi:hypothetical protein